MNERFGGEYSIVSAQQAAHAVRGDEAWCVAIDTEMQVVIESIENLEDHPHHCPFRIMLTPDVIIIIRYGDEWQAQDVWGYLGVS